MSACATIDKTELINIIRRYINTIPKPADGQDGLDGTPGIAGKDADSLGFTVNTFLPGTNPIYPTGGYRITIGLDTNLDTVPDTALFDLFVPNGVAGIDGSGTMMLIDLLPKKTTKTTESNTYAVVDNQVLFPTSLVRQGDKLIVEASSFFSGKLIPNPITGTFSTTYDVSAFNIDNVEVLVNGDSPAMTNGNTGFGVLTLWKFELSYIDDVSAYLSASATNYTLNGNTTGVLKQTTSYAVSKTISIDSWSTQNLKFLFKATGTSTSLNYFSAYKITKV